MTYVIIAFAILMALICMGHGMRKGAAKFDLVASLVFSVIFFLTGIFVWIGGIV